MLSFVAITPHPPLIIPNVGGENLKQIPETIKAMKKLGDILNTKDVDSLIVISPHGKLLENAFTINVSDEYNATFKKFGDFITKLSFSGDIVLAQKIKESTEIAIVNVSDSDLDHGSAVPLFYLTEKTKEIPIVPLGYSSLSYQDHFNFGRDLQKLIIKSDKKIAVVASGDLSHRLTPKAPAGFSPQGAIFDEKIIKLIKENNIEEILKLDPNLIKQAGECGLRSFITLFGILDGLNYKTQVLSYEGSFGVGYMVCNFAL